jgi:transposase
MQGFVQGADRQQTTLLPECLDDWIDESNPVRAVRGISLDLNR